MEVVKGLDGYLTVGKNIDVPTCVALSYILHYTGLNSTFSLEYCGVQSKTEAVPTSQAPSIHLSPIAYIGFGPICVPDQAPFVVWVESILPFTFVRVLDCEWLVVGMSQKHPADPTIGWVCSPYPKIFWCGQRYWIYDSTVGYTLVCISPPGTLPQSSHE